MVEGFYWGVNSRLCALNVKKMVSAEWKREKRGKIPRYAECTRWKVTLVKKVVSLVFKEDVRIGQPEGKNYELKLTTKIG